MKDLSQSMSDPDIRSRRGRGRHLHGRGFEEGLDGNEAFQQVLTMRARIDEKQSASFIREALREIHAHINEMDLEVAGPPFSLCHARREHVVDLEVGWPVTGAHGTERIHAGAIPASQLRGHSSFGGHGAAPTAFITR